MRLHLVFIVYVRQNSIRAKINERSWRNFKRNQVEIYIRDFGPFLKGQKRPRALYAPGSYCIITATDGKLKRAAAAKKPNVR